jgi:hypothetical protein
MYRHVALASSRVASQVMKSDVGLDGWDVVVAVDIDVAVVVGFVVAGKLTTCCPNHSVTPKEKVASGETILFRFDDDPEN